MGKIASSVQHLFNFPSDHHHHHHHHIIITITSSSPSPSSSSTFSSFTTTNTRCWKTPRTGSVEIAELMHLLLASRHRWRWAIPEYGPTLPPWPATGSFFWQSLGSMVEYRTTISKFNHPTRESWINIWWGYIYIYNGLLGHIKNNDVERIYLWCTWKWYTYIIYWYTFKEWLFELRYVGMLEPYWTNGFRHDIIGVIF